MSLKGRPTFGRLVEITGFRVVIEKASSLTLPKQNEVAFLPLIGNSESAPAFKSCQLQKPGLKFKQTENSHWDQNESKHVFEFLPIRRHFL